MVDDSDIPMTTYFSFYQVLTFLSVVMGTLVFGLAREVTGSLRYSVLVTSVFFILGLLILLVTKLDLKRDKVS